MLHKSPRMFALCAPVSEQVKLLRDRLIYGLYGESEALIFEDEEDAHSVAKSMSADVHSMPEEVLLVQRTEYRLMVRVLDQAPSLAVRDEMQRLLDKHWATVTYKFHAAPEDLGAQIRAILWNEGVSMKMIGEGQAVTKVQSRKPDTRHWMARKLGGDIPPEWDDVPFMPTLEYDVVPRT